MEEPRRLADGYLFLNLQVQTMSDQEKDKDQENGHEEVNPSKEQDATEVLLRKVAAELSEKSVNFAIIINDGASPRWIVSDVYWVMGVFQLISRRIEAGWDEDFFSEREDEDDDDEE